jgi:hypothetical protein
LWCNIRQSNPLRPTEKVIVSYLLYLKNMNKSYSVICTHKAVILETLKIIDYKYDRSFILINRFMKGLYNVNPPKPRYQTTWDVSKVLDLISTWMPLKDLSLKMLTYKLLVLITLCTASRVQTLKSLCVNKCVFVNNDVTFNCGDQLKTSKPGKNYFLSLKVYEEPKLCPVRTLKTYLSKTKHLRKDVQLFISYCTYQPVSTSTLARWLKHVLFMAGINVNTFKAHSYRGASVSAAAMVGCKTSEILKTADWSTAKNFKKFYLRDFGDDIYQQNSSSFSEAVLSCRH